MALNNLLATAVSGLESNARRAQTAANNIVNVDTPEFRVSDVQTTSIVANPNVAGGSGVQAQVLAADPSPSLVREITRLIEAEIAYKANAQVIRTVEDLSEETLDVLT